MSGDSLTTGDVWPGWRRLLEEAPAAVELPASGDSRPVDLDLPPDHSELGDPVELWGTLLAGLMTRYAQTDGPVVVTVADSDGFTPVVVDLSDSPDITGALASWRTAWVEQSPHALSAGGLALVADELPAVVQVVLSTGATAWPSEQLPAVVLSIADETAPELAGGREQAAVARHLSALAHAWRAGVRLAEVPLLDPAELTRSVAGGRGPDRAVGDLTVWDLVAATTVAAPEREAVRDARSSLTYQELRTRVEILAAAIASTGAGRGSLVGLCVDRGADMVVAMLAVHRCGAAYVPIDPSYPADRIAMMVEDAELGALVTEKALVDRVSAPDLARVLVDDALPAVGAGLDDVPSAGIDDLAYVIFTSGSTGRPKGVMIGQRALANFALSMAEIPGITAEDRLLAVTTLSFDIAELELLVPLTVGGCVVVADRGTTLDPTALATRLEADDITVMQATPATWRMLVDNRWPGRPRLKALCGGEALPRSLADELGSRCAELWNMYGPTETTIWSMVGRVATDDRELTIGAPIHNTTVVVADRWGNAVADGIAGELLIGGAGVAEGYLGRPDLTEERFVPDRLTGSGPRIYRTGDLVRRVPGRGVEFIGRIDGQVKVRGFRIELAEVEAALEAHPDVIRAVAVTRPDPASGASSLLAYVVGREDQVDGPSLRHFVGDRLPAYMVPSVVTVLDEFPLTLNGKIDRKSLPDPEPIGSLLGEHVAPRSRLESQLVGIWEDVLKVDGIGVTDDVFDLGSNSLVTARLFATVGRELDVELPIAAAFQSRTVAGLAALIEQVKGGAVVESHSSLVPIRTVGSSRPLFLVHGGAGTVLLFEPLARRLPADQPVFALQAAGLYGGRPPQTSIPGMARLYLDEIAEVQPTGPYRIGGYCFGALVAFEMAAQLEARGEQVELLISFNGPSPSYLREFRPLFDGEGALTDESGQRIRGVAMASIRPGALRRRLRAGEPIGELALTVARVAPTKAVRRVRRLRRKARITAALRLSRPLPDDLREAGVFQQLAALAQDRYTPARVSAEMLVVAGERLYHRDDLGWSDHVDGAVDVFHVTGDQLTPRTSMKAAFVGQIADEVTGRLVALDTGLAERSAP